MDGENSEVDLQVGNYSLGLLGEISNIWNPDEPHWRLTKIIISHVEYFIRFQFNAVIVVVNQTMFDYLLNTREH